MHRIHRHNVLKILNVDSRPVQEQKEDQIECEIQTADPWLESGPWQTALKDPEFPH